MNTPPSSPPRTQARDQPVFAAVGELLATHGMQLSMDAVAAHVGCSKQTLYSRYGSKTNLLRLVMQQHVATTTAQLIKGDSRPLRQILVEFAIHYLEHRNQPRIRQTAQLLAISANQFHEEARTLYNLSADAVRSQITEWLRTEMARGRLIHDDPQFMAELLISMLAGQDFERQRFHAPHRDTPEKRHRWAEFAIDAFLRAFPVPPTGIPGSVNKSRTPGVFPR
ncbi:TetR/AcrR family transcriptional regulator [Stenotrophomonas sp. LARHCG68]